MQKNYNEKNKNSLNLKILSQHDTFSPKAHENIVTGTSEEEALPSSGSRPAIHASVYWAHQDSSMTPRSQEIMYDDQGFGTYAEWDAKLSKGFNTPKLAFFF